MGPARHQCQHEGIKSQLGHPTGCRPAFRSENSIKRSQFENFPSNKMCLGNRTVLFAQICSLKVFSLYLSCGNLWGVAIGVICLCVVAFSRRFSHQNTPDTNRPHILVDLTKQHLGREIIFTNTST